MQRQKYYAVVVELEEQGYLVAVEKKFMEARSLANDLIFIAECQPWANNDLVKSKLENQNARMYSIKGNQNYFDQGVWGTTSTYYSITVLKVESKLAIETFIRERENSSAMFLCENYTSTLFSELQLQNIMSN